MFAGAHFQHVIVETVEIVVGGPRGVIALQEENCTSCMLCARECPSWCIYIDSHKETIPATTEGGRDRQQNVLDRFDIDWSRPLLDVDRSGPEATPSETTLWVPGFARPENAEAWLHWVGLGTPLLAASTLLARANRSRAAAARILPAYWACLLVVAAGLSLGRAWPRAAMDFAATACQAGF